MLNVRWSLKIVTIQYVIISYNLNLLYNILKNPPLNIFHLEAHYQNHQEQNYVDLLYREFIDYKCCKLLKEEIGNI